MGSQEAGTLRDQRGLDRQEGERMVDGDETIGSKGGFG